MKRFLLIVVLNFGALLLGSLLMGNPQENVWYHSVNKAPWTPPGWVFGAVWFTIMLLFAVFMSKALNSTENRRQLIAVYIFHIILNISWNPLFFRHHFVALGMVILFGLMFSLFLLIRFIPSTKKRLGFYLLPYFLWLFVAMSLNGYIWLNN
jgi:translocator protein